MGKRLLLPRVPPRSMVLRGFFIAFELSSSHAESVHELRGGAHGHYVLVAHPRIV